MRIKYRLIVVPVLIPLLLCMHLYTYGQSDWLCGDDKLMALQQHTTAGFQQLQQKHNTDLQHYIQFTYQPKASTTARGTEGTSDSAMYTIPVVIHVVHPAGEAYGTGSNISYAQIRSQIEGLNAAFSKSYPGYNGQQHPEYAQNTGIRFCLAHNPASSAGSWASGPGGVEYGVMRYEDNTGAYNHLISETSAKKLLGVTHPIQNDFPFDRYLNIWLVKSIDGGDFVMGYAPRPLMGNYPLDGIVMRADIFGDNSAGGNYNLNFYLTQGKILAHEMGHYFDLYHIFQGGCAGMNAAGAATDACDLNGDYICDIEPATTQNVICSFGIPNTCKANYETGTTADDMINDYMSYADDDCMNTFTLNQVQRMQAILGYSRRSLWQPANLAATGVIGADGCIPPFLNAAILTDKQVYCAGTAIRFSNPHEGNTATQYQWKFPGGTPQGSLNDTATVTYNSPGTYIAYLTISDGTNSRIDSLMIPVLDCKPDSSTLYMSQWFFSSYCSVDFSSGFAVNTSTALSNRSIPSESAYDAQLPYSGTSVSVCDSAGHLLFYSNGVSVWNNKHEKISDQPIFGGSDINYTTGMCYVPYVGNPDKYFIIGAYPQLDGSPLPIRFVTIDIESNNVTPYSELSHASLPKRFSELLTVVPHCNGTDYWVIVKGSGFEYDNNFYSFLVTKDGIDINQLPVISTGFTHPGYNGSGNTLKANSNGDKLILFSPHGAVNIESAAMYDFDIRTGEVKNERKIPNAPGYNNIQGGGAFSPNGEYFYLMRSTDPLNTKPYWLFQYRVSDFKYNVIPANGFYYAASYQLGPDNQLYVLNLENYLARVSNPDVWGGVVFNGEFMSFAEPGFSRRAGCLPSFIDAKRKTPEHPDFTTEALSCQSFHFSSICFDSYIATWNFGDGSAEVTGSTVTHTFQQSGHYKVTLTLSNPVKTFGSVTKDIYALPDSASITGPDSVCSANNFATQYFTGPFGTAVYNWSVTNGTIAGARNLSYAGVSWQNSTADSSIIAVNIDAGNNCSIWTSKKVRIFKKPDISFNLPATICITDSPFLLKALPSGGVFTGAGVTDSMFFPSLAGPGRKEITYLLETTLCQNKVKQSIEVKSTCNDTVVIPELPFGHQMPGAFTPNGDGINDIYRIPRGMINSLNEFSIYNRWGIKVFTTRDMYKSWNGLINGSPAAGGTYIYFISGTDENSKPVNAKGTVVLIR
jgi:gliding motility-associated-like protein